MSTLALGSETTSAQGNSDPRVFPRDAIVYGNTLSEWAVRYLQWWVAVPASVSPSLDPTGAHCGERQSGPVWFLADPSSGFDTFHCTVPAGKAIMLTLGGAYFGASVYDCEPTNPGVLCNLADLRVLAAEATDHMALTAVVDGRPLEHLLEYRVQTGVFDVTNPSDPNPWDDPPGTFGPNVADTYNAILKPLPLGEHVIYLKTEFTGGPYAGTTFEATYHVTIVDPNAPGALTLALRAESTAGAALPVTFTVTQPAATTLSSPGALSLQPFEGFALSVPQFAGNCAFVGWLNPATGFLNAERVLSGNFGASQERVARFRCP
ncbi:MAG: hypothetical protein AB7I50_09560 [Vicinamibacterales bacterium]